MRFIKIILLLLVLPLTGLLVLQAVRERGEEPPPGEGPGVHSSEALTNRLQPGEESVPVPVPVSVNDAESPPSATALISRSEATDFVWTSRTPAAKRVRRIVPDPQWMTPDPVLKEGDVITLALFDDAVFDARIRNVTVFPNGAVGMTARLTGGQDGTVYLAYTDQQMRVSVEVPGGADYYCRYDVETDAHYAIEVDPERTIIRPCGGDIRIPPDALEDHQHTAEPVTASEPRAAGAAPDGSTVIDVMIVYTPAALAYEESQTAMENNIALAMQRANEAHANSGTQITLRLVHSAETDYTESGDDSDDLNELTFLSGHSSVGSSDAMDDVHDWRAQYGADFVCLFSDTASVGGLGWLMTFESGSRSLAFCLAHVGQTDTGYTAVHEWGHNMGCSHSKSQGFQPWDENYHFRNYSAGWQWNDTYCTVMTYEDSDNDGKREYTRVPHFSNPNIDYAGYPTGDAQDGDNVRVMREMRDVYAGYFASVISELTLPYTNGFEEPLADWTPEAGSTPWFRNSGDDPSLVMASNNGYSGTQQAHSGDYFLMFDAENNQGGNACLDALFDFSGYDEVSLNFRYHMERKFPNNVGDLTVQIATDIPAEWTDLWRGSVGDGWREGTVDLSAYAGMSYVKLRFRADIGAPDWDWYYSYILLDDIIVREPPEAGTDFDNDGLPNAWELEYFGGETNAIPNALAANGVNTVMESYIAGLDPTDPDARFEASLTNSNGFVIGWNTVSGRVYSVLSTTNLKRSFQPLKASILWPQSSWTDTVNRAEHFYKVDVHLQE